MRTLFKEGVKSLVFFLISIFVVYVIIDFSTFSVRFFKNSTPDLFNLFLYYVHHFIRYLDIFLPLTLMLAIIRVLSDRQAHNEITPLLLAGISRKKLLIPFAMIALILTGICYLNFEFLVPKSLDYIEDFRKSHSKKSLLTPQKQKIGIAALKDGTNLVYQKKEENALIDVFWILSNDEVWHMKKLVLSKPPKGFYVDHIQRVESRAFEKVESFENFIFTEMSRPNIAKKSSFIPYENRSLSRLTNQITHQKYFSDEEKANILTHLHLKLAMPLLSLIILIALPPYLFAFTRKPRTYIISTVALASFVIFFTLIDSAAILGENQVLSPSMAIWIPFLCTSIFFGRIFYQMK